MTEFVQLLNIGEKRKIAYSDFFNVEFNREAEVEREEVETSWKTCNESEEKISTRYDVNEWNVAEIQTSIIIAKQSKNIAIKKWTLWVVDHCGSVESITRLCAWLLDGEEFQINSKKSKS